ncbi:MAG TPA: protein kinase [Labilithrix sp.]|nr:protein kinase [Labilithrix sp.]
MRVAALKPDNLFQTEDGTIKILDFGIARVKEHTRPELDTRSGTTMGTVGYMPPEQARGLVAEIDARTDVWAIGATLYSLLTARSLHEAATTNQSLLLAMTAPVPPMRELLPSLPPRVQELLDRSLAFAKDARFPSARAMKGALEGAVPARCLTCRRPRASRARCLRLPWGCSASSRLGATR